jgi:1,4-alpha-glucan branching enzyme
MFTHPGKKLLFMGCEFGQWNEWNCHESLDWHLAGWDDHRNLQRLVGDLNRLYRDIGALHEIDFSWEGFEWVDFHDSDQSIVSYVRKGKQPGDVVLCLFNCTPVLREGYRVGVPLPGLYREILNSDSGVYGGGNVGNGGAVPTDPIPWQGNDYSLLLTVPPLGGLLFRPDGL